MNNLILIDSDVLIDIGRGNLQALEYVANLEKDYILTISAVNQMELMVGCRDKRELQHLEHFLLRFRILPINELITETAISLLRRYRLSHGLLIADALIAATALTWRCTLVSRNERDYRFIEGLRLFSMPDLPN